MAGRTMGETTTKQAIGIANGKLMKIVCAFDIETWQHIRRLSVETKVSVAEMVRTLCEIGLEELGTNDAVSSHQRAGGDK